MSAWVNTEGCWIGTTGSSILSNITRTSGCITVRVEQCNVTERSFRESIQKRGSTSRGLDVVSGWVGEGRRLMQEHEIIQGTLKRRVSSGGGVWGLSTAQYRQFRCSAKLPPRSVQRKIGRQLRCVPGSCAMHKRELEMSCCPSEAVKEHGVVGAQEVRPIKNSSSCGVAHVIADLLPSDGSLLHSVAYVASGRPSQI